MFPLQELCEKPISNYQSSVDILQRMKVRLKEAEERVEAYKDLVKKLEDNPVIHEILTALQKTGL